jgi:hypothetical protein
MKYAKPIEKYIKGKKNIFTKKSKQSCEKLLSLQFVIKKPKPIL